MYLLTVTFSNLYVKRLQLCIISTMAYSVDRLRISRILLVRKFIRFHHIEYLFLFIEMPFQFFIYSKITSDCDTEDQWFVVFSRSLPTLVIVIDASTVLLPQLIRVLSSLSQQMHIPPDCVLSLSKVYRQTSLNTGLLQLFYY